MTLPSSLVKAFAELGVFGVELPLILANSLSMNDEMIDWADVAFGEDAAAEEADVVPGAVVPDAVVPDAVVPGAVIPNVVELLPVRLLSRV